MAILYSNHPYNINTLPKILKLQNRTSKANIEIYHVTKGKDKRSPKNSSKQIHKFDEEDNVIDFDKHNC